MVVLSVDYIIIVKAKDFRIAKSYSCYYLEVDCTGLRNDG